MKNEQILKMINENKIEELKEKIIAEIGCEENKEIPTYKAIQKLAKETKKIMKDRPKFAGAFYNNNRTIICDGYRCLRVNGEISGLCMSDEFNDWCSDSLFDNDYDKYDKQEYNLNDLKNRLKINKKDIVYLGVTRVDTNLLVSLIECLEKPIILVDRTSKVKPIVIKGANGEAILCPLRPEEV